MRLRHRWWHDHIADTFFAVATDGAGRIVSAWIHMGGQRWEALDYFGPLARALKRGEIHVNTDPDGYTDELGPSILPH